MFSVQLTPLRGGRGRSEPVIAAIYASPVTPPHGPLEVSAWVGWGLYSRRRCVAEVDSAKRSLRGTNLLIAFIHLMQFLSVFLN